MGLGAAPGRELAGLARRRRAGAGRRVSRQIVDRLRAPDPGGAGSARLAARHRVGGRRRIGAAARSGASGRPSVTVLCAAGIGSGRRGDSVREPLRGASALRLTALRPRPPAASPDRRGDGRAVIADGPLCRGARSGRHVCRAAAGRERRAACLAAVRLSRGDNGWFADGVAAPDLVVAGLAVAGRRDAVGAAMARQRRRPRDADRGAAPAGANRLVYGVSPRRPASRVSRRYCRHPDGAGGDARGDVGGRDRAVSPGERRWVRHDRRRRGLCRGDRVSGPGLSRRQDRRRDRARRRPRRDAARKLEPPACHPGDELWVFRLQPDHIADFMTAAALFVALLGGGPFLLLPQVARPGRWAALSAATPLLVLVIAYWRLQKFDVDIAWTLTALVLAAIELGAASWVAQRRNEPPETPRDRG